MPVDDDGRSVRNLCIWAITFLFFIFLLAGGALLLVYIILPQSPTTMWFPVIGMVLVAVPWLFWFTTWVYRSTVTANSDIEQPPPAAVRIAGAVVPSATSTAATAAGSPTGGDDSPGEGGRRVRFGTTTVLGSEGSAYAPSDVESVAPPSRGAENDGNSNAASGSSGGSSPDWHEGEEPPNSSMLDQNLDDQVENFSARNSSCG